MALQSDYITAKGERAKVTLPDGSHVLLNVASRLEVPLNFSSGNRTVRLTGEAFFDIASHTGSPFTVMTGTTATRVLGTSFVVRHYTTDTATTVAVRTGKVSVRSVIVTAAQEAQVGQDNIVHVHPANSAQFGFVNGALVFNSVPLSTAIIELDRWYNADIRLADPAMATLRMTGECPIGSLTDLSNLLSLTFDARVVRDGKVLTLYPK
jgi:ferric-dicitrate binding protein FerR (iron transport regulator)